MSKTKIIHPKIDNETIEIKSKVSEKSIKGRIKSNFLLAIANLHRFLLCKSKFSIEMQLVHWNSIDSSQCYASLLHIFATPEKKVDVRISCLVDVSSTEVFHWSNFVVIWKSRSGEDVKWWIKVSIKIVISLREIKIKSHA